jgi:hypothetical protein
MNLPFRVKSLLFLVLLVITLIAYNGHDFARAESGNTGKSGGGPTLTALDQKYHDVNDVFLMVSNQGPIGLDLRTGNGTGFFPANTSNNYIFGSGLWFGALYDGDRDGDVDKVFTQGYNPMAGDSEFREGTNDQDPDDPLTRIFDSTDPNDLAEWPDRFRIEDPETGELVPNIISDQDLVATYTTRDKSPVIGEFNMPIKIGQHSLAFKKGLASQTIILYFDIHNWGDIVMRDTWVGYDSDMDIGVAFADDLVSFIRDRVTPEGDTVHVNMAYAWDSNFSENNFSGAPGFVGIAYLRGPGNPTDGIDNDDDGLVDESPDNEIDDDGDGYIDEPDEVDAIGLVNFSKHCCPNVPCEVNTPELDEDGYDLLSCNSISSDFRCLESTTPADIRFMISSGPFDWLPGQTQQVVMALVFANAVGNPSSLDFVGDPPRPDPNDPALSELLAVKEHVQHLFDVDYKPTEPPLPPNLTLVPGDRQVILLWDDLPLRTPDPDYEAFVEIDPEYRQYDFQGFRVWRSRTGEFSQLGDPEDPDYPLTPEAVEVNKEVSGLDLTLLAQYDIADGIMTESDGIVCNDSVVLGWYEVIYSDCDTFDLGTDTGLRFSYVDQGDSLAPLINGFRYYYAVTAYDFNSDELPTSRLSLDSGVSFTVENSTIPRSNASSFINAFGKLLHVDETGSVLDDTSSIFVSSRTGVLDEPEVVHACNALVGYEFVSGNPEDVSNGFYTLVLSGFERVDNITNRISYYMEDGSGERVYTGMSSSFDLSYDGTDKLLWVAVFDPEDSSEVVFSSELAFKVNGSDFIYPDSAVYLMAVNASGENILDSLGVVTFSDYIAAGFRANDIQLEWVEAGEESLTLVIRDLDNVTEVPFGEGIVDSTGAVVDGEKGSNWSFLPALYQSGGRYFFTDRPFARASLWLCGVKIAAPHMSRMPQEGDVWTLRQVAYSIEVDADVVPPGTTYVSANRPPVPGTRYRIDTLSGGPTKGEVDLEKIRVVPNPYLANAAFDPGPDQRRLEFINLPPECTIRIYTISGNLVCKLEHTSDEGGTEAYDLRTLENLPIASGHYYYHITTPDGKTHIGRFAVVQ